MKRLLYAVVTVTSLAAALGAANADGINKWKKLHRPLHLPAMAPDGSCPMTPARRVTRHFGPAPGPGPVYPLNAYPTLIFVYPPQPRQLWFGSEWSGQKILWIGRPSYRGPVLVRGGQLDGRNEVRFGPGLNPGLEMRMISVGGSSPGGWQNRPSYTRLRAPGCYAWQVDGLTFSYTVVFRAVVVP